MCFVTRLSRDMSFLNNAFGEFEVLSFSLVSYDPVHTKV